MKKTKSLWVYAAVLFIAAIVLIFTATLLQARMISTDGNIEVLGTFTKNAKQNIQKLTEENISLNNQIGSLNETINQLKEKNNEQKAEYDAFLEQKKIASEIYTAYEDKDYTKLSELIEKTDEQTLEGFMPGLYEKILKYKR